MIAPVQVTMLELVGVSLQQAAVDVGLLVALMFLYHVTLVIVRWRRYTRMDRERNAELAQRWRDAEDKRAERLMRARPRRSRR